MAADDNALEAEAEASADGTPWWAAWDAAAALAAFLPVGRAHRVECNWRALSWLHSPPADGSPHPVDEAALRRWRRSREAEASKESPQEKAEIKEEAPTRPQEAKEAEETIEMTAEMSAMVAAGQDKAEEEEGEKEKEEERRVEEEQVEEVAKAKVVVEEGSEAKVQDAEESSRIAMEEDRSGEETTSSGALENGATKEVVAHNEANERKTVEENVSKRTEERKEADEVDAHGKTPSATSGTEQSLPEKKMPAKSPLEIALELSEKMVPASPENEPTHGRNIWIVVGGADSGGIIVRQGKSIQSPEYSARLTTGTKVEEMDIQGKRLHFRRLRGDGPDFGWVSIESGGGKKLMEEYFTED